MADFAVVPSYTDVTYQGTPWEVEIYFNVTLVKGDGSTSMKTSGSAIIDISGLLSTMQAAIRNAVIAIATSNGYTVSGLGGVVVIPQLVRL